MHFLCLCPTYGRPSKPASALAQFLAQDLPAGDTAHFVVFDDAGQLSPFAPRKSAPFRGAKDEKDDILTWQVISEREWIPLPRKYNALLDRLGGIVAEPDTVYVVWDDDDVYLPWHLAAIGAALANTPGAGWSHPTRIWSTYTEAPSTPLVKRLHVEDSQGRFHGALAIRGNLLAQLGGWPDTDLATYDQQQLAVCARAAPAADPAQFAPLSYVYRWADTAAWHCSGSIDPAGQYRQPQITEPGQVARIGPRLEAAAAELLAFLCSHHAPRDQ